MLLPSIVIFDDESEIDAILPYIPIDGPDISEDNESDEDVVDKEDIQNAFGDDEDDEVDKEDYVTDELEKTFVGPWDNNVGDPDGTATTRRRRCV